MSKQPPNREDVAVAADMLAIELLMDTLFGKEGGEVNFIIPDFPPEFPDRFCHAHRRGPAS